MPTDTITPRDERETSALSAGKRITVAIGIVGTALTSLVAALGGFAWLGDNLPLLLTGLGSLAGGGVTAYIAVRRMRVDKAASAAAGKAAGAALLLLAASGCTGVYTPKLSAISWGLDSAQVLSGLNVTRWQTAETNDYYEVILDSSSGSQSSGKLIDGLIAIGEVVARAKGLPVDGSASAAGSGDSAAASDAAPGPTVAAAEALAASTAYDTAGYDGSPGASGEGVYGRPSCARCRAYRAAHPDVPVINIDDADNRADMWAALRLRGFTGATVALPVLVTETAYTQSAK
ncbi:MAG TPA: hypothetical protein P5026_07925 [Kiritimatiellia bacterium]|nr:hypothetical protein [Kiritimatiellia bacterium]HRU10244.1 hypothetical protein [Thermoanaerobaculia bacterium]